MNDGKKVGIPFECILSASAENLSAWEEVRTIKYFVGIQNSEVYKSIVFSPERPESAQREGRQTLRVGLVECCRRNSGKRVIEEEKPAKGEQVLNSTDKLSYFSREERGEKVQTLLIGRMAVYGRAELGSKNDTLNSSHLSSSKLWINSKNNEKLSTQEKIKDYSIGSE
ncbi:hypothetical protein B0H13DRAFT_1890804 [Mycena leptocephala]|nr:hypothetical protein B0H13DRAFT_1890804 [Mycena leptocephala]